MRNCYFAADFFVHPTFYDPCSLVVLEALACGLPVITTRYNGAAEVLHPPREGFVIDDPHDLDQLAGAMKQLLDPARRAACARRRGGRLHSGPSSIIIGRCWPSSPRPPSARTRRDGERLLRRSGFPA